MKEVRPGPLRREVRVLALFDPGFVRIRGHAIRWTVEAASELDALAFWEAR